MGLKDLFFPKQCVGCGKMGEWVCSGCSVGMWEEEQICPACRRASRYGLLHSGCRSPLDGLACLWAYEGMTKKLVSKIKYGGYYDYLAELMFHMQSSMFIERTELHFFSKFLETRPIVVPVPLHKNRLRKRGFNQAELIADRLAEARKLDRPNLLERIIDTQQQVGRDRKERLEAMQGAFAVKVVIAPSTVLLVDDVWTTGATMTEAAKVLRVAGTEKVWGFVLAR